MSNNYNFKNSKNEINKKKKINYKKNSINNSVGIKYYINNNNINNKNFINNNGINNGINTNYINNNNKIKSKKNNKCCNFKNLEKISFNNFNFDDLSFDTGFENQYMNTNIKELNNNIIFNQINDYLKSLYITLICKNLSNTNQLFDLCCVCQEDTYVINICSCNSMFYCHNCLIDMLKSKNLNLHNYYSNKLLNKNIIIEILKKNIQCNICHKNNKLENLINIHKTFNKNNKYYKYLLLTDFIDKSIWYPSLKINNDDLKIIKYKNKINDSILTTFGFILQLKNNNIIIKLNNEFLQVMKYNKQIKFLSIGIEKINCFVFNIIYTEIEKFFLSNIMSYNVKNSKNIINNWEKIVNKIMKIISSSDPDNEILNILN